MENVTVVASREQHVAYLLLRVIAGMDFFGHGFARIFTGVHLSGFAHWMVGDMAKAPLPPELVLAIGFVVPWVELLVGSYFAMTVYYAVDNENYITVPFLLLFVVGYWYTGLMSLLQGRFAGVELSAETHSKPFPVGV